MKMKWFFSCVGIFCATATYAQEAVLYTGSDWCQISPKIEALWSAPEFKEKAGIPLLVYDVRDVDTPESEAQRKTMKAYEIDIHRFPAIAYFDADKHCLYLHEGLPYTTTAYDLEKLLSEAKAQVEEIKALADAGTVDGVGEALQRVVEQFDAGRSNKDNTAKYLWNRLKEKDPNDASGWHFALTFNPLDGACYKMQEFAKEKKYAEGEKLLGEMKQKPQAHLTTNQRQGIELLYFILHRDNKERRQACVDILKAVVEMDATTHFGAGALGYLCMWGEGPIAVPYGWRQQHVKRGKQTWKIDVGMQRSVPKAGRYALTLKRTKGKGDMSLVSIGGKGIRATNKQPTPLTTDGTEFMFLATTAAPTLELTIEATDPSENEGQISIRPLLPARTKVTTKKVAQKSSKKATTAGASKKVSVVEAYARMVISKETIAKLGKRAKGADFLEAFFGNKEWMEDFFSAGEPTTTWDHAFNALETIYYHHLSKLKQIRRADWRWASAAALNAEEDPTTIVQSYLALQQIRKERLLVKGMDQLRVDQMRFTFAIRQGNAESLLWMAHAHHVPPHRYGGVCWFAAYRTFNYFGDSIHGAHYYRPWDHIYVRHEMARKVGGVCGSLSHYGCMAARAHGIPATTGGQPAHCAYNVWQPRMKRWEIDYNVGAYTGAHFLPWQNVWSFAYLDLQNELFAAPNYKKSMRQLWQAEILRQRSNPKLTIKPMQCAAYVWTGNQLPTDFASLEKLGEWEGVKDFSIDRHARKDGICYVWTGEFTLSESCEIFAQALSDDGAKLFIDGEHVGGDDGLHGLKGKSSVLNLTKGTHAFEVRYFNKGGGRQLQVNMAPREVYQQKIDDAYTKATALCPINFNAWRAYVAWASGCSDKQDDAAYWVNMGRRIARGMGHHLEPAWQFLNGAIVPKVEAAEKNPDGLMQALIDWHHAARQGDHETAEFCNYEAILNKHQELLKNDKAKTFPLFEAILSAQYGTSHAFGRVMRWGGKAFLDDEVYATRYVGALNHLLAGKENAGDTLGRYVKESIREASNARNIAAFKALCELQDKLAPKTRAPLAVAADVPLLSGGLLRLSSTSQWDHPEAYGHVIDDKQASEACHTGKEKSPWAELMLPGPAEVSRVYLLNTTGNQGRIVPFAIEVSEDGTNWKQVASETQAKGEYTINFPAVKAQYIRIHCTPQWDTFLHVRKFNAFGKKLY
jgi:hypothetical protein